MRKKNAINGGFPIAMLNQQRFFSPSSVVFFLAFFRVNSWLCHGVSLMFDDVSLMTPWLIMSLWGILGHCRIPPIPPG